MVHTYLIFILYVNLLYRDKVNQNAITNKDQDFVVIYLKNIFKIICKYKYKYIFFISIFFSKNLLSKQIN